MKTKESTKVFVYMWEYHVQEESIEDFEHAYGPHGDWVQLFKKGEGYLFTDLHRDVSNPQRYITTDYWESKEARDSFRIQFSKEFKALDHECESFTEQEVFLGDFESDIIMNRISGNNSSQTI